MSYVNIKCNYLSKYKNALNIIAQSWQEKNKRVLIVSWKKNNAN